MDLRNLIDPRIDLVRLSKDIDEIGHFARVWSVRQWTRANMATVWDAAKGFRALTLDDFVPGEIPPLAEVIHEGAHSSAGHGQFRKCFCRPSREDEDALFGYVRQTFAVLTGPGYFVAHPSAEVGEVDLDHAMVPSEKPVQWPDIVASDGGLGRFVYDSQVDVMRGLSAHVSIGRVKRKAAWTDRWLVLVRRDLRPEPSSPAEAIVRDVREA